MGRGGRQNDKFATSLAPLKRSTTPEKKGMASMEKKMVNSETMYFEDQPADIQDVVIDFIVSIIENKQRNKAEIVQGSDPGIKSRRQKGLPRKKRAPSR